jgi:hypothetical protein
MQDQVCTVEGGGEKRLVALELRYVRHDVARSASMPSAER